MSMSVEQRRTEVLRRGDWPLGSVRLSKGSSRYDRRFRFFSVELLPASFRGSDEDYGWRVLRDWPVRLPGAEVQATAFFAGALAAVRGMS